MTEASPNVGTSKRKDLIKARWGILRDALLQNSQQNEQRKHHSIHRFSGYHLLRAKQATSLPEYEWGLRRIEPLLTQFNWDCEHNSLEGTIDRLEIAILALAACFPKGKCMKITRKVDKQIKRHDSEEPNMDLNKLLEAVKARCRPVVCIWKVSEETEQPKDEVDELTFPATMVITLLVQESSKATKHQTLYYDLSDNDNTRPPHSHPHIIWTREPRENKLSLEDLVSHRKNNGVDNTGNICVWDSERTLAYLLYNHFDDFVTHTQSLMRGSESNSRMRILELGTGMAGLSALALGMRLALKGQEVCDQMTATDSATMNKKSIHITLTDGNPSGVKNNDVNQYLTKLNSQMMLEETGKYSHYLDLDVKCENLLWTTDEKDDAITKQDILLVSDCVHFQNFHAALATTTLRCLKVGASAIFCQPTRGLSLDNFYNLLRTATSDSDETILSSLLSCSWMSHLVIDEKHNQAVLQFHDVYDANLHHPKILVVTKLREISADDIAGFIAFQTQYSPIKS